MTQISPLADGIENSDRQNEVLIDERNKINDADRHFTRFMSLWLL